MMKLLFTSELSAGILQHFLFFAVFAGQCVESLGANNTARTLKHPTVILISFDGFRWDYFDKIELKNFQYVIEHGVKAESLQSSFITKTFPNHFTLVTGLHVESHGIMASRMFDPLFNETFSPRTTSPKWWNAATPIWIKNELHNITSDNARKRALNQRRKSAAIFWVGSNVKYDGQLPSFYMPVYNESFPTDEKLDLIVKLLREKDPPNFIACYINEPDKIGHGHGPDSNEVRDTLSKLDISLGKFLNKMRENEFLYQVNLVFVSDHGMANIHPDNQIILNNFIDPDWYTAISINTFASIIPKKNHTGKVYEKLKTIPNLTVYLKDEIPQDLHYKNNRRMTPIFALADEGYVIVQNRTNLTHTIGNHGYLSSHKSMHGIFVASGPAFKKSYVGKTFSNVHIYSLLCKILDIEPSPNNGSIAVVEHFLIDALQSDFKTNKLLLLKVSLIAMITMLTLITIVGLSKQCRNKNVIPNGYMRVSHSRQGIHLYNLTEDLALHEGSSDEDEI